MQTYNLLRQARKAVTRQFSVLGGIGKKKYVLKPLKKEEEVAPPRKLRILEDDYPSGSTMATQTNSKVLDPLENNRDQVGSASHQANLQSRNHSGTDSLVGGQYKDELARKPVEASEKRFTKFENFAEPTSNWDRKLKRETRGSAIKGKQGTHGNSFKVFSDERYDAGGPKMPYLSKSALNDNLEASSQHDKDGTHIEQLRANKNREPRTPISHEAVEFDQLESSKQVSQNQDFASYRLSSIADPIMTEDDASNLENSPQSQAFEALNIIDFKSARVTLPKRQILLLDQEDEEISKPATPKEQQAPTLDKPTPKFKFGAKANQEPNTHKANEAKPKETNLLPQADNEERIEPKTKLEETTGSSAMPSFKPKPSKPQAVVEQNQTPKPKEPQTLFFEAKPKTLPVQNDTYIVSDEDAESVWNRFVSYRDEIFFDLEHSDPAHHISEAQANGNSQLDSLSRLSLKLPLDSAILLDKFNSLANWSRHLLLGATHQIQAYHNHQQQYQKGHFSPSSSNTSQKGIPEAAQAFDPTGSLYFQSFIRGLEEVVYSILETANGIDTLQEAQDTENSIAKNDKLASAEKVKKLALTLKKAIVYLKIESKSHESIEELVDLANSLLTETPDAERRFSEYLVRFPNIQNTARSLKYSPYPRPEDSQIELMFKKLQNRQDELFQMKRGTAKLLDLLKRIGKVFGRPANQAVFIHSFSQVTFAVEFTESIIDGILESKKNKSISQLVDLLDCLHDLRAVSKGGRSARLTNVLLAALESPKTKLSLKEVMNLFSKWSLMYSSTEMNQFSTQSEQVSELLLQMYKNTPEFKSNKISFTQHLVMMHALSKSKVLDREVLFETIQSFFKEGLEALDYQLANYRRFFRSLGSCYYVIAEEPQLLNLLYEHITAQLPEMREALRKSKDPRDRRYSAISMVHSLAILFPPSKIGLHAEYLLGEVKQDVQDSLDQGYTKPEVLMLGGLLELLKGIWTFDDGLGVEIIKLVKTPGFFKVPVPSMAAFEVAETLGKLKVSHRMEVNLGHMVVDIIVDSSLPGEIELAIDVHGPPHEFRNCSVTLGNQQFKSRLLASAGIGYFQIPLHVWSLLDQAGKRSYLLKGIRVLRDKGSAQINDPAEGVIDASKITMRNPKKQTSDEDQLTTNAGEVKKRTKISKKAQKAALAETTDPSAAEVTSAEKPPRKKRVSKSLKSADSKENNISGLESESSVKEKPKRKSRSESKPTEAKHPDPAEPVIKSKRGRKPKKVEAPIEESAPAQS